MVLDCGHGDAPPADAMALLAGASHLPAMKVGVTISALLADAGKNELRVALPAFHAGMHSAKRINGFRMLEVREGTNWPVAGGRMTVVAGNAYGSVRAGRGSLLFIRTGGSRPTSGMQRVTPGACAVGGFVAQRRVTPALLILHQSAVTVEALEFRLPFCEAVAIGAVLRSAQHRGVLF